MPMHTRIRMALILAVLLLLVENGEAFAKGNFAFVMIKGKQLTWPVRVMDPALTSDFLFFIGDFNNRASAPPDPGVGYEVLRYYLDQGRPQVFDELHYYPESGYVYYDGLGNGWSEYDGKWYRAKADIKELFIRDVQAARLQEAARHVLFIRER